MDRGIEGHLGKEYLEIAKKDGFVDIKPKTPGGMTFRETEESLMERMHISMHEAGLKIDKECKVLTIHGSEDIDVLVEDGVAFSKIITNHELKIIQGANHCYDNHRDELVATALAFIKDNLHRV